MTQTHVVLCGLPRSGSTMLYAMMRASGHDAQFPPREGAALRMIGEDGNYVTKRPLDVFEIDRILDSNARGKNIKIVLTLRDPRSIVVSRHASYPYQPFIGFDQSLFVEPDWISFTNPGLLDCLRATRVTNIAQT